MLLVWCFWLSTGKRRFIKLDLVTAGQFLFHFSRVLGSVVDCVNVNPARAWHLNHALRDAQNVCALTKVGTVLKMLPYHQILGSIVVSIPACHAGDRGSIPRRGETFSFLYIPPYVFFLSIGIIKRLSRYLPW